MDTNSTTITALPKILFFTGLHDAGPADGGKGSDLCPHCGADGRYTYLFHCDDGSDRGAMAGCVKLFPVSEIAQAQQAAMAKEPGRRNSWDKTILQAVEDLRVGAISEARALAIVREQKRSRQAWQARKFGGRR